VSAAPSSAPGDALAPFLAHLRRSGVRFDVAAPLRRDPDEPGHPHGAPRARSRLVVPGLPEMDERRRGRIGSDHATWSVVADMAAHALVRPGGTVWEIGAGTGMIAVAAHHLGAGRIVATDLDPQALEVTRENLAAVGATARLFVGSLLAPVPSDEPPPDLVVANLPHKPNRGDGQLPLAEDGGPDGDALLQPFWAQAAERVPAGARVVFFQHSLPHPRNLETLAANFDLRLLSWKRRFLADGEYGTLQDWFVERAAEGTSYLDADEGGRRFLVACVWLATRR